MKTTYSVTKVSPFAKRGKIIKRGLTITQALSYAKKNDKVFGKKIIGVGRNYKTWIKQKYGLQVKEEKKKRSSTNRNPFAFSGSTGSAPFSGKYRPF